MATHLIVRVCAIAVTIGVCSIATLAEPINISAKLSTSVIGASQPNSAFVLRDQAIFVSGAKQTSPTSLFSANNTQFLASGFEKRGTASAVVVPEPSAILLLGSGLLTALGYRAKRRTKSR